MIEDNRIKPCPFCGIAPKIRRVNRCDNFLPDNYTSKENKVTRMVLVHPVKWNECPIATNNSENSIDWLGNIEYDTIDELISFWNRRAI